MHYDFSIFFLLIHITTRTQKTKVFFEPLFDQPQIWFGEIINNTDVKLEITFQKTQVSSLK